MLFEPFEWQAKANTGSMQITINYENIVDEEGGKYLGNINITVPYDLYLQRKLCEIANNNQYKIINYYGDKIIDGDYMLFNVQSEHSGKRFSTNVLNVKDSSTFETLKNEVCPLFEVVSYIAYKTNDSTL